MCKKTLLICTILAGFALILPLHSSAGATTSVSTNNDYNAQFDFFDYISAYKNFKSAKSQITIQAADYQSNSGAKISAADNFENSKDRVIKWTNQNGELEWVFNVPADGLYRLGLQYYPLPGNGNPIELGIKIDGKSLFSEMDDLYFPRMWENASAVRTDSNGNEFAPDQTEDTFWETQWATDPNGTDTEPFVFALTKGIHKLVLRSISEPFALDKIYLAPPDPTYSYNTVEALYKENGYQDYDGQEIDIQGEDAQLKSAKSLVPMSDNYDPSVSPSDAFKVKINYIGSYNWETPGDTLTWKVHVKTSGLYKIGFRFRQSYLTNCNSYRKLTIDGKVPFQEASAIPFQYTTGWSFFDFGSKDKPYAIYLSAGDHELSMQVTMGPMSEISRNMKNVVYNLGKMYRKIVMVTGDTPDMNRDYNLFGQIPDLKQNLTYDMEQLNRSAVLMEQLAGKRGSSGAATLRNMSGVIQRMLNYSYQAQQYKDDFYNNYCSVSSWLYEMRNMPLDLDEIVLASPDRPYTPKIANIAQKAVYSTERFFASFVSDYNNISEVKGKQKHITVWLNWGRDQAQVLNFMAKDMFTPKTGVYVDIKLVNASLVQAILSGNGPDCSLMLSRSQPVNLAMRGALYNLKNFKDFSTLQSRYMPSAMTPYNFKGGCYALPDTQQFYTLFYRTDIFSELNITVPKTWDDFLRDVSIIERNNMQVGIPYTQITDMNLTDMGVGALNLFPTILEQFGGSMYNSGLSSTALASPKAIQAFTFWTDLYTKYKLPVTYDFYNRFRTGTMPMAIAPYTQYALLTVAAPEIDNCWAMAPIPGVMESDGKINNIEAGGGTGAVILNISKNKNEAWEFLKWWTSDEAQYRYSADCESILGVAARNPTANVNALSRLSWKSDGLKILLEQWNKVQEIPEVPGGYYTARIIDQAFWNTTNQNDNPRDMIVSWSKQADQEIARKRQDYNIH